MSKSRKNQKGFAVFEVLFFVLIVIILVGAAYYVGKHNSHTKTTTQTSVSKTSTSSGSDSTQVVKQVQAAYAAFLKTVPSGSESEATFVGSSGYYTAGVTIVPITANELFCDQNVIPAFVSVANPSVSGINASVHVTKNTENTTTWPSFTVNLTKINGKWLISGIDCTTYLKQAASIPQYQ